MAGTLPFSYKLNPQLLKIFELNSALFHSTSFLFHLYIVVVTSFLTCDGE